MPRSLAGCRLTLICMSLWLTAEGVSSAEQIVHIPPDSACAGEELRMTCALSNPLARVRSARLYYKNSLEENFQLLLLQPEGEIWTGLIPAERVAGRLFYYFAVALENGGELFWPEVTPELTPAQVRIVDTSAIGVTKDSPTELVILSPEVHQVFTSGNVLLALSLSTAAGDIEPTSVAIHLDGRDVTPQAAISDFVATMQAENLPAGAHTFTVAAMEKGGRRLTLAVIPFTVVKPEARPRPRPQFTGRAFAEARFETVYQQPESFAMSGAEFSGRWGALDVTGSFFLTSLEKKISQPRDRFSLSVAGEAFSLQAGDVYPRYNELILRGKRVRGLSGRYRFHALQLQAVMGQTYRAVETVSAFVGASVFQKSAGVYEQQLTAIRPSFFLGRHAQFGMTLAKMKDDARSIDNGGPAKDNLVFGPDLRLTLDRGRIEVEAQGAWSLLTRDTRPGAYTNEDIKGIFRPPVTLPFNPSAWSSLLIINDSTTPLSLHGWSSLAARAEVKLRYYRHLAQFGIKRIGSQYQSLANSWLRQDVRGFFVRDRFRLLKNQLFVNAGWERNADSYSRSDNKPTLMMNTADASLSWYPGKKLPHVSVGIKQYDRGNDITAIQIDSLTVIAALDTVDNRDRAVQRDFSLQVGQQISFLNVDHYLTVSYILAVKNDRFSGTRLAGIVTQDLSAHAAMLSWTTSFAFPLRLTCSYANNNTVSAGGLADFRYESMAVLGEYDVLDDRASFYGDLRLISTRGKTWVDERFNAQRRHMRFGGNYRLTRLMSLSLEMQWLLYSAFDYVSPVPRYTDHFYRIRCDASF